MEEVAEIDVVLPGAAEAEAAERETKSEAAQAPANEDEESVPAPDGEEANK